MTSRLTREKSFFSFSTICPGMQILLDRIICLQAMYNADGGLDNKSRSPSPILVGVIVFWPCVRHFSHTVVTTLVSATILFGKVYSQSQISLCLKHSHERSELKMRVSCQASSGLELPFTFFLDTRKKKSSNTIPGQICCFFFGCSF